MAWRIHKCGSAHSAVAGVSAEKMRAVNAYVGIPGFENLYLEDSWVLGIAATPGRLEFRLDLVLTQDHPLYHEPLPNEVYCHARGSIAFVDVDELTWSHQGARPATDATGEVDFGNIDSFTWIPGRYELDGDWGDLVIKAHGVEVTLN